MVLMPEWFKNMNGKILTCRYPSSKELRGMKAFTHVMKDKTNLPQPREQLESNARIEYAPNKFLHSTGSGQAA